MITEKKNSETEKYSVEHGFILNLYKPNELYLPSVNTPFDSYDEAKKYFESFIKELKQNEYLSIIVETYKENEMIDSDYLETYSQIKEEKEN